MWHFVRNSLFKTIKRLIVNLTLGFLIKLTFADRFKVLLSAFLEFLLFSRYNKGKKKQEVKLAEVHIYHKCESVTNYWTIFKDYLIWHNLYCQIVKLLLDYKIAGWKLLHEPILTLKAKSVVAISWSYGVMMLSFTIFFSFLAEKCYFFSHFWDLYESLILLLIRKATCLIKYFFLGYSILKSCNNFKILGWILYI